MEGCFFRLYVDRAKYIVAYTRLAISKFNKKEQATLQERRL